MKVLDLACQHGHGFEGWFGSEEDFQSQLVRGLVQCPMCDSAKIIKKLSAPRLNLRGVKEAQAEQLESTSSHPQIATSSIANNIDSTSAIVPKDSTNRVKHEDSDHPMHALMRNPEFQTAYMQMAKEVLAKTEDVGEQFASEARKIHHGDAPERGIRGQVSRDEAVELLEEGIDVMPLPLPVALKNTLQ